MKDLTLILGPMSSGKSFDLIGFFAPLKIAHKKFVLVQPTLNCRDKHITSRNGNVLESEKIEKLTDLEKYLQCEVIGIDEIHLFCNPDSEELEEGIGVIKRMLNRGVKFVISGLDMDYRGFQFPIIRKLFELAPSEIRMKTAVCTKCNNLDAKYTQVLEKGGKVITSGLDSRLPDDGRYTYEPRCRQCFNTEHNKSISINVSRW